MSYFDDMEDFRNGGRGIVIYVEAWARDEQKKAEWPKCAVHGVAGHMAGTSACADFKAVGAPVTNSGGGA